MSGKRRKKTNYSHEELEEEGEEETSVNLNFDMIRNRIAGLISERDWKHFIHSKLTKKSGSLNFVEINREGNNQFLKVQYIPFPRMTIVQKIEKLLGLRNRIRLQKCIENSPNPEVKAIFHESISDNEDLSMECIIESLVSAFYGEYPSILRRVSERENINSLGTDIRRQFIEMCKEIIPREIIDIILSYLVIDSSLLFSLGCTCSGFYISILQNWKTVRVTKQNVFGISLLSLKYAKTIIFSEKSPFEFTKGGIEELEDCIDIASLDYLWKNVNSRIINTLKIEIPSALAVNRIVKSLHSHMKGENGLFNPFVGLRTLEFPRQFRKIKKKESDPLISVDLMRLLSPHLTTPQTSLVNPGLVDYKESHPRFFDFSSIPFEKMFPKLENVLFPPQNIIREFNNCDRLESLKIDKYSVDSVFHLLYLVKNKKYFKYVCFYNVSIHDTLGLTPATNIEVFVNNAKPLEKFSYFCDSIYGVCSISLSKIFEWKKLKCLELMNCSIILPRRNVAYSANLKIEKLVLKNITFDGKNWNLSNFLSLPCFKNLNVLDLGIELTRYGIVIETKMDELKRIMDMIMKKLKEFKLFRLKFNPPDGSCEFMLEIEDRRNGCRTLKVTAKGTPLYKEFYGREKLRHLQYLGKDLVDHFFFSSSPKKRFEREIRPLVNLAYVSLGRDYFGKRFFESQKKKDKAIFPRKMFRKENLGTVKSNTYDCSYVVNYVFRRRVPENLDIRKRKLTEIKKVDIIVIDD